MNIWITKSINFAATRNYLDELYKIYPTNSDVQREIDADLWKEIEDNYNITQKNMTNENKISLLHSLLKLDLFPIKDSYVAYLRRDPSALSRNPATVSRLVARIFQLGLDAVYERVSTPKEANRQIGPMFKKWIAQGTLGYRVVPLSEFENTKDDCILNATDTEMMQWCRNHLNYDRDKGLDFVARKNGKYIIGETKFLTDFGGHQNAQLNDAFDTLLLNNVNAIKVAILDGVIYIRNNGKMYKKITGQFKNYNIMSALLLQDFLATI